MAKRSEVVSDLHRRRERAEDVCEMSRHAKEQLEQMIADGAEELGPCVSTPLIQLRYALGQSEWYYMGQIRAYTEAIHLLEGKPI